MSDQHQGSNLGPEGTKDACVTLLEADIAQRAYVSPKIPASMVNGKVSHESHDVSVNGRKWEWWKVFDLGLPVSSSVDKPICVSTIGSSGIDCNIVLQHDEINPIHCRIYAQCNSGHDCWIVQNLSDTIIKYSNDDRFGEEFYAAYPGRALDYKSLSRGQIALHHLRGLVVGPFTINLRIPFNEQETQKRLSWFRYHLPCLVSEQMLRSQTDHRNLTPTDFSEISHICTGGYGEVGEVMEKRSGLKLAMKVQLVKSREKRAQVDNEIRNLQKLQSPFIVDFLMHMDFDRDNKAYSCILMPLYKMDLSATIRIPEFTMEMRECVMFQVATGLAYMHKHDLLHRDLKPGNILIATLSPVRAVLADLGVSAYASEEPGRAGTKFYWPPEYRSSIAVATFATDMFALGLTFFEIIDFDPEKVAHGVALQDDCFTHPPKKWSMLVEQMTYHSPQDRPQLQEVLQAIKHGQDMSPNEDSDKRNAHYSALARFRKRSGRPQRATPSWSASSASSASQDLPRDHTLKHGEPNAYLSATKLQANEGHVAGLLRTNRPSNVAAVGDRLANKRYTSAAGIGDAETPRNPSNTKPLHAGNATSDAPTESLTAQRPIMPPQKSPRHRRPAKVYDVLRRVRAGRIAKPKATSGSDPASDTPRLKIARPGSWRATEVARELEKNIPETL